MTHQGKRRTRKKQLAHDDRRELRRFREFLVAAVKDGATQRQAYADVYGEVLMDATNKGPTP